MSLLLLCSLGQRVNIHFYYEGYQGIDWLAFFDFNAIIRSFLLINSTVLLVGGIYMFLLYLTEKERAEGLQQQLFRTATSNTIDIKSDKRFYRVPISEIYYPEGMGNYITYHLNDRRKLISYSSLKEALARLPGDFLRIHKSYIVNRNHIHSYNSESVEVNGRLLPIGKSSSEQVLEKIQTLVE